MWMPFIPAASSGASGDAHNFAAGGNIPTDSIGKIMSVKTADKITWKELNVGNVITEPGNSLDYKTGSWKSRSPVWDNSKCIKCGICYIFCPDNSVIQKEDGYFEADLDFCKGCGICAKECFTQCIKMV
jgi:pyruvate ferredoxin oxidoreductase delta subunit